MEMQSIVEHYDKVVTTSLYFLGRYGPTYERDICHYPHLNVDQIKGTIEQFSW